MKFVKTCFQLLSNLKKGISISGKVNMSATNLENDFADGVKFIILIGIVEGEKFFPQSNVKISL